MKRPSAAASIVPSGRNGVSMIGERQTISRSTTRKRLESPCDWRCSVTLANSRCEVELPMSMPIVRSSTFSWLQMKRAMAALSSSLSPACSWSKSASCIANPSPSPPRSGPARPLLRFARDGSAHEGIGPWPRASKCEVRPCLGRRRLRRGPFFLGGAQGAPVRRRRFGHHAADRRNLPCGLPRIDARRLHRRQ